MKRYLLPIAFMAASFSAYSSTVHPAYEGFMQRVGGTSTTVSFASDGKPILVGSRHLGTPNIGAMGVTTTPDGVRLRSAGGIKIPGRPGTIPVIASTVLSRSLLGRAVQIALPMAGIASTAYLFNDLQIIVNSLNHYLTANNTVIPRTGSFYGYFNLSHASSVRSDGIHNNPTDVCFHASRAPRSITTCNRLEVLGNGDIRYQFIVRQTSDPLSSPVGGNIILVRHSRVHCASGFIALFNNFMGVICATAPTPLTQSQIETLVSTSILSDSASLAASRIASDIAVSPHLLPQKRQLPVQLEFPGGHQSVIVEEAEPQVVTRTRVLPDGNIETKTQTTQRVARINPITQSTPSPTVQFEEQTVTKRKVTTPTGQIVLPEETVSTETKPKPQEQPPNCGLPNTPPCRIYEPQAMPRPPLDDASLTLDTIRKDIEACLSDIPECLGLPDISFSFRMPTGCSPLALPGFQRWIQPINICTYKPYFHSVMSMVWAITGVFGAMAIIGRRF